MSGPEDVLDVMHDCAERLRTKGCFAFAAELDAARATVAELIEAAEDATDTACPCRGCERLRTTLARCRGEA